MIEHFLADFDATNGDRDVVFSGSESLPAAFAVTDFAASSIAAAGLAVGRLSRLLGSASVDPIVVDRRLASLWFGFSIVPDGWALPPMWDQIAGDYETTDGYIRLHTNAARHRAAVLQVLGCHPSRRAVETAAGRWSGSALESAVVDAGGCAAQLLTADEWQRHPQGAAVAGEPLVSIVLRDATGGVESCATPAQPMRGVRVLDLTRILAGPVATRFLAGLGADVLRIDPIDWDEPSLAPEITLGKRCARIDLRSAAGHAQFVRLLSEADILVHGYRPGALDQLGLDATQRTDIAPHLIDVALDAYGWNGPRAGRRGFDSLVQMSAGIADTGRRLARAAHPVPLPVQALDHATGYLMAQAAIDAWRNRLQSGRSSTVRTSLARTAKALTDGPQGSLTSAFAPMTSGDLAPSVENTSWGKARRVRFPVSVPDVSFEWSRAANPLGSETSPTWLPR